MNALQSEIQATDGKQSPAYRLIRVIILETILITLGALCCFGASPGNLASLSSDCHRDRGLGNGFTGDRDRDSTQISCGENFECMTVNNRRYSLCPIFSRLFADKTGCVRRPRFEFGHPQQSVIRTPSSP